MQIKNRLFLYLLKNFRDCITVSNRDSLSEAKGLEDNRRGSSLQSGSERHCKGD